MKNIFTALLVGSAFTLSAVAAHAGDKKEKKTTKTEKKTETKEETKEETK